MSTLIVEIVRIKQIDVHPNADKLELAQIKGWQCVVPKGEYKAGDLVLYIPIDSILPPHIEGALFPEGSKIKLDKSRVRTIKIRGAYSQGMVCKPEQLNIESYKEGDDFKDRLGITKFEPQEHFSRSYNQVKQSKKNPHFFKYTDIENYANYPDIFIPGEKVTVTEKIHGANFRFGLCLCEANTFWKKVKRIFGFLPKYEFCYGSHNVQLQDRTPKKHACIDQNFFKKAVEKYNLKDAIEDVKSDIKNIHGTKCESIIVYGEIYGPNIQSGYHYGIKDGDVGLVVFDVMVDGKYLNTIDALTSCIFACIPIVPVLYNDEFDYSRIEKLTEGDSVLCPTQKVREGVVIKPVHESTVYCGRKVLKLLSKEYLANKNNTEFH